MSLFTVGYTSFGFESSGRIDRFIKSLKSFHVDILVDVRSYPVSKNFSDFDEESLVKALKGSGIRYVSAKDEFGARRSYKEPVYDKIPLDLLKRLSIGKEIVKDHSFGGKYVNFEKVYTLDIFQEGVKYVVKENDRGHNLCFMCSEDRPWDCHRCIMVSEYFRRIGYEINHIHGDSLITQEVVNDSILRKFDQAKDDYSAPKQMTFDAFFKPASEVDPYAVFFSERTIENAIRLINMIIGYKRE